MRSVLIISCVIIAVSSYAEHRSLDEIKEDLGKR